MLSLPSTMAKFQASATDFPADGEDFSATARDFLALMVDFPARRSAIHSAATGLPLALEDFRSCLADINRGMGLFPPD